jgi:hypothetical protein
MLFTCTHCAFETRDEDKAERHVIGGNDRCGSYSYRRVTR